MQFCELMAASIQTAAQTSGTGVGPAASAFPGWVSPVIATLAIVVALLKEEIQAWWRKPKLTVRGTLAPPDSHKTTMTVLNKQTGAMIARVPCYYLRIWVENAGTITATDVQVFVSRLSRFDESGRAKALHNFLPMNLRWAHTGDAIAKGLSRGMGRHCDLGHIVHPSNASTLDYVVAGAAAGQTVFCLDLEVPPATMTHLWPAGDYRLDLRVAAANTAPVEKSLRLKVSGQWFDDEAEMFVKGVELRELD
jgi:hypothetical protein